MRTLVLKYLFLFAVFSILIFSCKREQSISEDQIFVLNSADEIYSAEINYFPPIFCDDCEVEDSFDEFHAYFGMTSTNTDDFNTIIQLKNHLENSKELSSNTSLLYNLRIILKYDDNSEHIIKIDEAEGVFFKDFTAFKLTEESRTLINKLMLDEFEKGNVKCIGELCNEEMINESRNHFKY